MELVYNEETKEWEQRPEPFITIECETEEDFEFIGTAVAFYKKHLAEQEKPQNNADRIRAMSDEELADYLRKKSWRCDSYNVCKECPRYIADCCIPLDEWLKQPAEG